MGNGANGKFWVGLDLGGTKMMAVVYDSDFKVVGRERKKTKAYEGAEAGTERIARTVKTALELANVDVGKLAGIGVGAPGQLDLEKGSIINSPNLGWNDVALAKKLGNAMKCPVTVLNDVDAGVYGEYALGSAKGARCVVGVFPGTGIGGGCVYQGSLVTGGVRSCMEIGHLPMVPNGTLCGCGRRGCLETVASRLAIAGAAAAAAYRGEAPYLMKMTGCNIAEMRAGMIAEAIKEGDKAVERIVKDSARWLGKAVSIVVNLLTPDMVLLGGGLVEAMKELYLKEIGSAARDHVMPAYVDTYKLVVASLGDDAVAAGAASWAARSQAQG